LQCLLSSVFLYWPLLEVRIIGLGSAGSALVADFAAFAGPKLAVRYEDLVAGPAAAAAVATFLGSARAEPALAAALVSGYGALTERCRRAGGRDWLGVRRSAFGYGADWPAEARCRLGELFEAAWEGAGEDVRAVLEAYRPSAGQLLTSCSDSMASLSGGELL
jgi:hypothetical protein